MSEGIHSTLVNRGLKEVGVVGVCVCGGGTVCLMSSVVKSLHVSSGQQLFPHSGMICGKGKKQPRRLKLQVVTSCLGLFCLVED